MKVDPRGVRKPDGPIKLAEGMFAHNRNCPGARAATADNDTGRSRLAFRFRSRQQQPSQRGRDHCKAGGEAKPGKTGSRRPDTVTFARPACGLHRGQTNRHRDCAGFPAGGGRPAPAALKSAFVVPAGEAVHACHQCHSTTTGR